MKAAILIVLLLVIFSMVGLLTILFIHISLKNKFDSKTWMDNSEFDYGHDVHYDNTDF